LGLFSDINGEKLPGTTVILFITIVMLVGGELALRFSSIFETYSEKNGVGYWSLYAKDNTKWYRKRKPGDQESVRLEYTDRYYVNKHGFRDRDWPESKQPNELRILTLGGSAIEGMGSLDSSSSYPGTLGRTLQDRFGDAARISVMNGGMGGEDPIGSLQALKRVFYHFRPDMIVQSVDETDWKADIPVRGGMDRFNEDGTITLQGPWFEPLFERSHLVRAVVLEVLPYNKILMTRSEHNRRADEAVVEICRVFKEQSMIAEKVDADLIITVTAGRNEILRQAEPDDRLLSLLECATPYASVAFDLGAEFLRRFSPKQMEELYWPIDGHFKPEGYNAYAEIVAAAIEPLVASRIRRNLPAAIPGSYNGGP